MAKQDTLCWKCAKACGRCAWSQKKAKPVKGWKAKKTKVGMEHGREIVSYIVRECPEYEPDGRDHSKVQQVSLPTPEYIVDEIVKMRDAGMSYDRIAEELEMCECTVRKRYHARTGGKHIRKGGNYKNGASCTEATV